MANRSIPRVLSGIQPSGSMHIGNYLGAIKNWVEDQNHFENFFMIADYHAITATPDPNTLQHSKRELVALLLACGIDSERSVLFCQSDVKEHVELSWILTCVTPLGWLKRMTQYKDKTQKAESEQTIGTGIFLYPTLMTADILLYHANDVPVGEDQRQHVELTRDIAQRFNILYGETFTIPKPLIRETVARIMSLTKPDKKMSKSEDDVGGRIGLLDSPKTIEQKIMRATTDSHSEITFRLDPSRAGIHNLLSIYQAFSGKSELEIEQDFAGQGYADLKRELASLVISVLYPVQKKYAELTADMTYIDKLLEEGAAKARSVASVTLSDVRKKIGID